MADPNNSPISETAGSENLILPFIKEVFTSPLNVGLLCVCAYLLYKIISSRTHSAVRVTPGPVLPPMKKRDFTLEQLREYDGSGHEGRILLAVNGYVYDVSAAKNFYGKGGPYAFFAGRDASRGLATFNAGEEALREGYDDLSDLDSAAIESMREWEMQFKERYQVVGRLLKPGEEPQDYTDTEDGADETGSTSTGGSEKKDI